MCTPMAPGEKPPRSLPIARGTGVDFEVFQKAEKRNADLIREAGAGGQAPVPRKG